jgi:hypothetical protein
MTLLDLAGLFIKWVLLPVVTSGLVVAPAWWLVERRRARLANRQKLVESWRQLIAVTALPATEYQREWLEGLKGDHRYLSLRPHLSADFRERLDCGGGMLVVPAGGSTVEYWRTAFADEIGRIERRWKLV